MVQKRNSQKDGCVFSCRFRAATRTPSWLPPLEAVPCSIPKSTSVPPFYRNCTERASTTAPARAASSTLAITPPRIYVALTTIPGREKSLAYAVASLQQQRRQPERILVSAARFFSRLNLSFASLSFQPTGPGTEIIRCDVDDGPGTKLLCALPRIRTLAAEATRQHGPAPTFVALVDDDIRYRPWATGVLDLAIRSDAAATRAAFAYDTYTLMRDGRQVTAAMYPGLLVGSGASMYALRLSRLAKVRQFYHCLKAIEPRVVWHDDVWMSMYVQDVLRTNVWRIGGTPYEVASRTFPEPRLATVSYSQAWALSAPDWRLGDVERYASGGTGRRVTGRRLSGTAPPSALVAMPNRTYLNKVLAALRERVVAEGLCGVPLNATRCVGDWCHAERRAWGAHKSRMPWEGR